MQSLYRIKEMLCRELDEHSKKDELTQASLETIDKLTHALKSVETVIAMREAEAKNRRRDMGRNANRSSYGSRGYYYGPYGYDSYDDMMDER